MGTDVAVRRPRTSLPTMNDTRRDSRLGPHPDQRDDRTLAALELLLGDILGPVALSHFDRVTVAITVDETLAPHGVHYLALETLLNELTRFIGTVLVMTSRGAAWCPAVHSLLQVIERIDPRPGKTIAWTEPAPLPMLAVHLHLGAYPPSLGITPLSLAYDGWSCRLTAGFAKRTSVNTAIPFGALTGVSLIVAEAFKRTLAMLEVDKSVGAAFQARQMDRVGFSALMADWVPWEEPLQPDSMVLPPLPLDQMLLVGGGAVGNAALWALAHGIPSTGILRLVDPKQIVPPVLNRCLYFSADNLGLGKADTLARKAAPFPVQPITREVVAEDIGWLVLSTVDNNAARHVIQEALPACIIEGATNGTHVSISRHTAVDGHACLICLHPDRSAGLPRTIPLDVASTANHLRVDERTISSSEWRGDRGISNELLAHLDAVAPDIAEVFAIAKAAGQDLCGALGEFRYRFGLQVAPREPALPFVSAFAGFMAAATTVRLVAGNAGIVVPSVPERQLLDLARRGVRNRVSRTEAVNPSCSFCQARRSPVRRLFATKWPKG